MVFRLREFILIHFTIEFSRNTQSWQCSHFLYYFVVKGNLISAKSLPPVGIEPATLYMPIHLC